MVTLVTSPNLSKTGSIQPVRLSRHYMERVRANGQIISVEGAPLSQGGWVAVYTDITSIKKQENMLRGHSEELSGQLLTYAEELAAKKPSARSDECSP